MISAYPNAKIDVNNIVTYAIALSELSEVELSAGVLRCIRIYTFFPSIAQIMEASQKVVEAATGTGAKDADEAWRELCYARQIYWPHKKPVFSTPEIEETVNAMGWVELCVAELKDIGTTRAQFLRLYEAACKRQHEKRINDNVIAIIGADNLVQSLADKKAITGKKKLLGGKS